jgi:hypothetical protein
MYQVIVSDGGLFVFFEKKNCIFQKGVAALRNCRGCITPSSMRSQETLEPIATSDRNVTVLKHFLAQIERAATPRQAKLLAKALGVSYPKVTSSRVSSLFSHFFLFFKKK